MESQTIDYALNPQKFKEDLEVAVLEGKATGETILKTIENIVNGGKDDIGEPERRAFNEIKESIVRVKTAPEMDLIAKEDLTSKAVLDRLKIDGIEKFNPDDPDLPKAVRERLDELAENGLTIGAFYDKTTNKIFINEKNINDENEIRALVAREWKISEDLKNDKGKPNSSGQLKSTVAGEVAYDDILKRGREGKTKGIDLDGLNYAEMSEDSEVTSDSSDVYVQRWDEEYAEIQRQNMKKADESYQRLISQNYSLGEAKLLQDLKDFSYKSPYDRIIISPYFGFYYLPKSEQKKYFKTIKDKDGESFSGLMVDIFDKKGYEKLKNKEEYTLAMLKVNTQSYGTARDFFEKNGLKTGKFTLTNDILVTQNFVSHDRIGGIIPEPLGIAATIRDSGGLDVTLRKAAVKSYIVIDVSEETSKGEKYVTITRYTRIGDKFEKPLDLIFGLPDNSEKGNPYRLLTNYEKHEIYKGGRFVVKGKTREEIIKEVNTSMERKRKTETLNIMKKDSEKAFSEFQKRNPFTYKYLDNLLEMFPLGF